MQLFTTAIVSWFDDGCCDVKYLDIWRDAPLNYTHGQATGSSWHTDHYELILARDSNGRLFQKAADLLMRYHFYPNTIVSSFGDFNLGSGRRLRVGDRIVQRVHIAQLFGRAILDVIGITEVNRVVNEPRRQGLTYITAVPHIEQGEWSAHITWRENGDLVLTVNVISRPAPQEPTRNYPLMRALQKKAHVAGISHFKNSVLA